jgi:hypothetical protein
MVCVASPKFPFHIFCPFLWACAQFLVPGTISSNHEHRSTHGFTSFTKTCLFHVLCPFSWAIAHNFSFSGQFPATLTTHTWFEGHRQISPFSCFPPFFVGYSAHFSVPGMISTDREHRYIFRSPSLKTRVVYFFCRHFRGLELTVFSFRGYFQ